MNDNDLTLPDQIPDPDWSDVKYAAETLLEVAVTRDDDDTEAEKELIFVLAENVLMALYGPHVDDMVRELRERRGL